MPSNICMKEITNAEMHQHHEAKPKFSRNDKKGHKTPSKGQEVFRGHLKVVLYS